MSAARTLRFVKMEGAGNDYVYVDGVVQPWFIDRAPAWARRLADRHFGIGGDGLIVLSGQPPRLQMSMWNADGSRGAMCGNGLRCLAKLAFDAGHARGEAVELTTDAGVRRVTPVRDAAGVIVGARAELGRVTVAEAPGQTVIDGTVVEYWSADAGNPHAVVFVDEPPARVPLARWGAWFQALPEFEGGVNLEVVQVTAESELRQRTFERGSGETLACGSGAAAVAVAACRAGHVDHLPARVELDGGCLVVHPSPSGVVLEGPARTVFTGEIEMGAD